MLIARTLRLTPTATEPDGAAQAGEAGNRLFELLISEAHSTAVGVAVIATAANALNDWRASVRAGDMARLAPESSGLRTLLPVLVEHDVIGPHTVQNLRAFAACLDDANADLDCYFLDCEAISKPRAALIHARPLQARWGELARVTKTLIVDMEREAIVPLPDLHTQNTRVISALLAGAANGLKPCLDDRGRLYVPPLPQRRRAPRRAVLQNCIVRGPSHMQTAFVRDASAGGLGLGRIAGLKRGDRVRVDFACGRQFRGTIAWVTGSSAGLRFDTMLDPSDALIAI